VKSFKLCLVISCIQHHSLLIQFWWQWQHLILRSKQCQHSEMENWIWVVFNKFLPLCAQMLKQIYSLRAELWKSLRIWMCSTFTVPVVERVGSLGSEFKIPTTDLGSTGQAIIQFNQRFAWSLWECIAFYASPHDRNSTFMIPAWWGYSTLFFR